MRKLMFTLTLALLTSACATTALTGEIQWWPIQPDGPRLEGELYTVIQPGTGLGVLTPRELGRRP